MTTTPKEPAMPQVITDAVTDTSGELVAVSVLQGALTLHATDDPDPAILLTLDDPAELLILAGAALDAAAHRVRMLQHAAADGNAPDQARISRLVHHAASTAHQLSGLMLGLTR